LTNRKSKSLTSEFFEKHLCFSNSISYGLNWDQEDSCRQWHVVRIFPHNPKRSIWRGKIL